MQIGPTLTRSAERWPDREALVQGDRRLTYAEWNDKVNKLVDGLRAHDLSKGDPIGIFSYNSIEQMTTFLAAQKLGAVGVPLNYRLAPNEVAQILNRAGASALYYDGALRDVVHSAFDGFESIKLFFSTHEDDFSLSFESIEADGDPTEPDSVGSPRDTSAMLHTSGTTGLPKLVSIAHRSHWINNLLCSADLGFRRSDRTLHIAPLFHSGPLHAMFLPHLHIGATNVIQRKFDPEDTLRLIERESISSFLGVPTHFQRLREHGVDADVGSIRYVVTTGSPLSETIRKWVIDNVSESLVTVYGLTEATSLLTVRSGEREPIISEGEPIGRPLLDVDVEVVEPTDNAEPGDVVETGERGQLIARTDKLMDEYFEQPEATAEVKRKGWLYTGDIVVQDDFGHLYLVDRMDNMIVSGGENIYPQHIERVLNEHPEIEESGVVGEPDPDLGERVVAYIVGASSVTVTDIEEYWKGRDDIANFKRPREVYHVSQLPRNASGKILRRKLRGE